MPSDTPKMARAMAAAAQGKGRIGIPMSVAKEFNMADAKTGILRKKKKQLAANDGNKDS